jgi:hypothetical protein
MASEWLYSRDGTDYGPVSSAELAELAKNGQLLPTDWLWKEGMAEWKPARSFQKLFPPEASADEMPVFVVKNDKPKAASANDKTRVRQATTSLKAHAQTAGRLATLTAEKTRIVTVSLPLAYAELGKHRYETHEDVQAFTATFEELNAIATAIIANSAAVPGPQGTSLADKAKRVASQGIQIANSQKLALQQKALFAKLGKEVYAQQGGQAGPESLVKAIEPLVGRLATLERELAENVKKAGGKKRLWLIGGGVFLVLMILAGIAKDADNKGGQGGGTKSSGRGRTNSKKSDEWKQGAETGRGMVDSWKRSVRDKDPPLMSEGLLDGISKVARLYLEDVERVRRAVAGQKAAWGRVTPDEAEALQRVQDIYNGFMSEAGPYVR